MADPGTSGVSRHSSLIHSPLLSKPTPVSKWGLKFTGEKGTSVNAFLERVSELKIARHVHDDELFDSAVDLFAGKALVWYRDARRSVNT